MAFSPDGRRLLSSSSGEGAAKLWDAETGKLVRMFRHAKGSLLAGVTSAVFSPDGTRLATGGAGDKMVNIWSAETGQLLKAFGEPGRDFIYRVRLAFSPDGTRVLVGDNSSLRIWDAANGTPVHTLGTKGLHWLRTSIAAFSSDGAHALTNDDDKGLQFWSVETGQLVRTFKPTAATLVAMSPDGARLLSSGWGGEIKLWDAAGGQLTHTFEGRSSSISSMAASPGSAHLVTVDTKVRLWDTARGRLERIIDDRLINSIAFSPDGARLLAGGFKSVKLWDLASGQLVRSVKAPTPERVAFSADGTRLLSFSTDSPRPAAPTTGSRSDKSTEREGSLTAWDAASGREVNRFNVPTGSVFKPPIAFSHDAAWFLPPPNYDQPMKVWDAASGQAVHTFGGRDTNHLRSAAFSPDKTHAVTGHINGALHLWELAGGQQVRSLWHSRTIEAVAFSRDGGRLLTGSGDATIKLWDAATGQTIRTFDGPLRLGQVVTFTPDEKRVISGSDDSTVRIWDAATGEQLAMLLTAKTTSGWSSRPRASSTLRPRARRCSPSCAACEVFGIDQFYQEPLPPRPGAREAGRRPQRQGQGRRR